MLRHRRHASNNSDSNLQAVDELQQSVTDIPGMEGVDRTLIPTAEKTREREDGGPATAATTTTITPKKSSEFSLKKLVTRFISGSLMIASFYGILISGHVYVCLLVILLEILLFRELVKVRYNAYYETILDTIPLFRTTQWLWFVVAIVYTYGDFVADMIQNNPHLHYLGLYSHYWGSIVFLWYSATFVLTITTLQVGHVKFQLNQLCWTIVVLCLTVGQLRYIMHNIFNGLFWFCLPVVLVITNDVMAYFCGLSCGRKFIHMPFISLSPNKTWEGFIGGGFFTLVAAWFLSRHMAKYTWMTCPTNEFRFIAHPLECDTHHVFQEAQSVFPAQMFELFPSHLVKMIPGIVEYCKRMDTAQGNMVVEPCISGAPAQAFSHFELILKNVYPVQIHALWLGLFASLVAPFGGFLASAIKRAYGIKDFDSLIPGHGGVTDRLDCQFLMALYTWVHYNTFIRLATISVPKMIYMFNLLNPSEQQAFLNVILRQKGAGNNNNNNNNHHLLLQQLEEYAY